MEKICSHFVLFEKKGSRFIRDKRSEKNKAKINYCLGKELDLKVKLVKSLSDTRSGGSNTTSDFDKISPMFVGTKEKGLKKSKIY